MSGQVLLLLYNASETMSVLQSLGVETASWQRGVSELMVPPIKSYPSSSMYYQKPERRSVSPPVRRRQQNERGHREMSSSSSTSLFLGDSSEEEKTKPGTAPKRRSRSPPPRTNLPAGVYVVDVQEMHQNLFRMNNPSPFRSAMADLRIEGADRWCAGNDCRWVTLTSCSIMTYGLPNRYLLSMWLKMVSGNSIDLEREKYQPGGTGGVPTVSLSLLLSSLN